MTIGVETNLARGNWPIGAAMTFRVLVTEDGLSTGTPVNLSAHTYQFVLRRRDRTQVFIKTTGSGISYSSVAGTSDAADVAILRADTVNEIPGIYHWALWRTDNPNDRPAAYGSVELGYVAAQGA